MNNRLIIILLLMVFSGCAKNPFSSRDSDPPLGAGGTWETPQTPEVALRNLLYSYNEKNISNYELCLADSFVFSAPEDSIDAVNNGRGDLFADWGRMVDIAATTNIFHSFSDTDSANIFLTLARSSQYADDTGDSTATLYRDYTILIIKIRANISDTLVAKGLATYHMSQEQLNWWTIRWWEDIPDTTGHYDWGDFKAEYR